MAKIHAEKRLSFQGIVPKIGSKVGISKNVRQASSNIGSVVLAFLYIYNIPVILNIKIEYLF